MSHPFTRILPPSGFWNEALVYGDLVSEEARSVLSPTIPLLTNFSSKGYSGTWRSWEPTNELLIDEVLSVHPVSRIKDGNSIVFATSAIERYETVGGIRWGLCSRRKEDILAISAAGFDVDSGRLLPHALKRLRELGLFSILSAAAAGNEVGLRHPVRVSAATGGARCAAPAGCALPSSGVSATPISGNRARIENKRRTFFRPCIFPLLTILCS